MTREELQGAQRTLDLKELVKNATWRDILMELVESNSIDPWNIDIGKIANEYVQTIKKMQVMDLHIPANMTLAASILLRMKSDTMIMFKEDVIEDDGLTVPRQIPDVPELIPKFRLQPHKKVTLSELMDALDDAIRVTEDRVTASTEMEAPLDYVVIKDDIDVKIASAYKLISSNMSGDGIIEYSKLARMFSSERNAVSDLFIPILFLAHKKEIDIAQEQFFGDIMISLHQGDKTESDSDE